ncbi:MAG TPA: diaminopimelate epimerase [Candidatus Spyradosoma merdigallinarum]|uniref:Diaminopimelate epimerase n=1 Tax=Candidatus Spyradosoma merdigallinarum TaxID=2840950 RepID=A0A9D1T0C2_9BACT|nr:diaminopimelate epimerase [Candidatus Spyradosoma merdigallinarum]
MNFTKMHSAGNDYVYVNGFEEKIADPGRLAAEISHRHFGVGSDGLVIVLPSQTCDFRMRMFNADGSEAEMCGNAACSVGKFVFDNGLTDKKEFTLETLGGVKHIELGEGDAARRQVRVDMGAPIFDAERIPVAAETSPVVDLPLEVDGKTWRATCVSMGNPHAVIFTENVAALNLPEIGPKFEHHPAFPRRTNTEFIEVLSPEHFRMRVWERGAGETFACGTGACASVAAGVLKKLCSRRVRLDLLGGRLDVEWSEADGKIRLTGFPTTVFTGTWR